MIEENLMASFPSYGSDEIKNLRKAYHFQLSQVIIESLKGFSMTRSQIATRFEFQNAHLVNKHREEGRSLILVLGHIGNWEWGLAVVSSYLKHNCIAVYKPLSDKSLNDFVLKKRSQYGVKLLPLKKLLKYLISHQEEPNIYLFLADQYPPNEPRIELNFLERTTYFDASVEKISIKYDLPVFYVDIEKIDEGRYKTNLIEISSEPKKTYEKEITSRYAELLEANILRSPQLWLWSHRRWKT